MSLTTRVLIGLAAGFATGMALTHLPDQAAAATVAIVTPAGTIFINLIRMTVIPLVASLLVAGIGSMGESRALGRAGGRAIALAIVLVAIATVACLVVAQPVLARMQVDRSAVQELAASSAPAAATAAPSAAQWLIGLVPTNVFEAAANDAMLPVIVFAVLFGLALGGIAPTRRHAVLTLAQGIADVMQRLVAAILELAPFGVFALAVPLAARLGASVVGAVATYLALVIALTVAATALLLYPLGIVAGGLSPAAFASFCAPAQAVAFSSRSSLAALPAMLESAERAGSPPIVTAFILPLAASVFRFGAAVAQTVGVLFLARLYGATLSAPQLISIGVAVIATTFAVPGIPGGSILAMVPVLRAADLPIEGIGILLAVDAIPDMFRTTANVTGSLTIAAVLRRHPFDAAALSGGALPRPAASPKIAETEPPP
jgi:Na+/H+-dicarboxylate symporter